MAGRLAVACSIALITLLGFFVFPGHTYLHSDTQIYVPMMEHLWDPSVLPQDLVAAKPHLSYTIYDEVPLGLRGLTGLPFEAALVGQQLLFRAMQALGIYLLATALPLAPPLAMVVAAIAGLGASIPGPAVLLLEYEPVPRGFAIGLIFLAIGLVAQRRWVLASTATSVAFLYHAPTTLPFWLCFLPLIIWRKQWRALLPLAAAVVLIMIAARFQAGVVDQQHFWFQLDPELERLQRLRAPYNWASNWAGTFGWQYLLFSLASVVAYRRVSPQASRVFLIGLPVLGLLSVPASYILLERLKWGLISQIQPARALLFVTAITLVLATAAALRATRLWESVLWFAFAFAIPMQGWFLDFDLRRTCLALVLAFATTTALHFRYREPALALVLIAAYLLIPSMGRVVNYRHFETPDVDQLSDFASQHTAADAVFLFPDAAHGLQPGIFRARALRSVYVDWKAGGQVNYYRSLADDWWLRWQRCNQLVWNPATLGNLSGLGINYLVVTNPHQVQGHPVAYQNRTYTVYRWE